MASKLSWIERWTLWLYSCLAWLLQPWLRKKLSRRAKREHEYGLLVEERFGRYQDVSSSGWVWVHAVSLGETRAAALLIDQLRALWPGMTLLLTHSTATGWAAGNSVIRPGDRQAWLPWDTRQATQCFLAHFRPLVGVLLETEVWPNLVHSCAQQNMPLMLVNARLNASSFESANRLRWLSGPAYANLTAVLAQGAADAERFEQLGAKVNGILGNIKFDAQPAADHLLKGREWRRLFGRPVLALISCREGEEAAFISALLARKINGQHVDSDGNLLQILVVPRHPQRVDDVASLFVSAGFSVSRRSEWKSHPIGADVWLGDTMGELALYYAMCDVALLGGSFERFGGQNLIEAAACGCPLVMGPHTYNFAEAAAWAELSGAARQVVDMATGVTTALEWMHQPGALADAQGKCLNFAHTHQGASQKTALAVMSVLTNAQAG